MSQAKTALEQLSQDRYARQLAEDRRRAEVVRGLERAELLAEGIEEGRVRTLREAIADLATMLALEMPAERKAHIATAGLAELEAMRTHLLSHRRWP